MRAVGPERQRAALRLLPSVERVLQSGGASALLADLPRNLVTELVRDAIEGIRKDITEGQAALESDPIGEVSARAAESARRIRDSSLRPVINATGVILHTNLGRAPLGLPARGELADLSGRYTNLEYDVSTGKRGKRDDHCGFLLEKLLGRAAIVVNNNAAAIFLVLRELARDGEVVVSRGELVEIGDGFRIPDILESSGAKLREVGTTNRTRVEDYRNAIGPHTRAVLRVHPSNFRQVGFTGKPSVADLAGLAREAAVPLVEDLGSGCLLDLEAEGITEEPTVTSSLGDGANLVTFSGDKLLGGPQAGVIAGDEDLVMRIRRNPLFRALRVDKLTLAALAATLRCYLSGAEGDVPVVGLMRIPHDQLIVRAEKIVGCIAMLRGPDAAVLSGESVLGGGSTPMRSLPSAIVAVKPSKGQTAHQFAAGLRAHDPPVVGRIERGRVMLDLRTVFETEEQDLVAAVLSAAGGTM